GDGFVAPKPGELALGVPARLPFEAANGLVQGAFPVEESDDLLVPEGLQGRILQGIAGTQRFDFFDEASPELLVDAPVDAFVELAAGADETDADVPVTGRLCFRLPDVLAHGAPRHLVHLKGTDYPAHVVGMELGGALGIDSHRHRVYVFGTVVRGHYLQATAQGGTRAWVRTE